MECPDACHRTIKTAADREQYLLLFAQKEL